MCEVSRTEQSVGLITAPFEVSEEEKGNKMQCEQGAREEGAMEDGLGNKLPVDAPLIKEVTAKIKSAAEVRNRRVKQER